MYKYTSVVRWTQHKKRITHKDSLYLCFWYANRGLRTRKQQETYYIKTRKINTRSEESTGLNVPNTYFKNNV